MKNARLVMLEGLPETGKSANSCFFRCSWNAKGRGPDGFTRWHGLTLGQEIKVCGLSIKDPHGKRRSLTPQSDCAFYVECLPVVLLFGGPDRFTLTGGQIRALWTVSGTPFVRV